MRCSRAYVPLKGYLGDAVVVLPLLEALDSRFDSVEIETTPLAYEVVRGNLDRASVRTPLRRKGPLAVLRHARALRERRYAAAVLANHSFRSALVARLAGIPVRIGHPTEGRGFLLTHPVPHDPNLFVAADFGALATPLGISPPNPEPKLRLSNDEREAGKNRLAGATIGVQPGARFPAKRLDEGVVRGLLAELLARGRRPALLGGPDEREYASRFAGEGIADLVGVGTIRQTIGCLSQLEAIIGADTGLMHLAAGSGCRTVTVFGPTSAARWGHAYGRHRVVRAPGGEMGSVSADAILAALDEAR